MTDQVRYKTTIHTPGDHKPPKPEIVRFDQAIQDQWNAIKTKQRELQARLNDASNEINQIKINLGAWVAEDCDYKEHLTRLAELRLEQEALELGINYLTNQGQAMKRNNPWLASR